MRGAFEVQAAIRGRETLPGETPLSDVLHRSDFAIILLRARAIETGCFVLAPAQTGQHPEAHGPGTRRTFGHSPAVAPWGEVLADGGTEVGITYVTLDMGEVARARSRVPSLTHDRSFDLPA